MWYLVNPIYLNKLDTTNIILSFISIISGSNIKDVAKRQSISKTKRSAYSVAANPFLFLINGIT